jgi:hypothetical protein
MPESSLSPSSQVDGLLARWSGLLGTSPISFDDAEQAYSQALQPLAVGVFDADAPGAYNSQFKALANQQEGKCCLLCAHRGFQQRQHGRCCVQF